MKKAYRSLKYVLPILIIITIIMQMSFFISHAENDDPTFFFLFISPPYKNYFSSVFVMLHIFAPIIFFLFWTSSDFLQLISGYGKVELIRGVSRDRLLLKTFFKTFLKALLFFIVQTVIYQLFCKGFAPVPPEVFLKASLSYIAAISTVLLMQMFLQLSFEPMKVNLAIFLFCTASCFVASIEEMPEFMKVLTFPYLMFGCANGSFAGTENWILWFAWLIILGGFFLFSSLRRYKKTDIF